MPTVPCDNCTRLYDAVGKISEVIHCDRCLVDLELARKNEHCNICHPHLPSGELNTSGKYCHVHRIPALVPPTVEYRDSRLAGDPKWFKYFALTLGVFFGWALGYSQARAYDLERCEWLGNQAFQIAYMRDAGVTLGQVKSMIRNGGEREEVKVGAHALARYVYAQPKESPEDLAARLERECRGYEE